MEDRSKKLNSKKLCYTCFGNISKEHSAKSCAHRRMYKVWSGTQWNTPQCCMVWKSRNIRREKKIETPILRKTNQEKYVSTGCIKKCASSNIGSDVIRIWNFLIQIKLKDTGKTVYTYVLLDSCSQGTFILNELTNDLGTSGRRAHL